MLSFFWIFAIISTSVANATSIGTENPELIIHEHRENGQYAVLKKAIPDLKYFNWGQLPEELVGYYTSRIGEVDDEISSVQSVNGDWELYQHKNYQGNKMFVENNGSRIGVAHNDQYSSARPVCTYQEDATTHSLRVFEHSDQQRPFKDYYVDQANLAKDKDKENWHDKISSVRANKGDWELYQHEDYSGDRQLVREGDQINVNNDHWSSLRPVCQPYSAPAEECILKRIEILEYGNIAKHTDTKIVGVTMDGYCIGTGKSHLNLDQTDSFEETVGVEISNSEESNWSVSVNVGVTATGGFLGNGVEASLDVSASGGGSTTYSSANSNEISTAYAQSVGQGYEYQKPGVAVLVGLVDMFTIDNPNVPVKMHMECGLDKTKKTEDSNIKLTSTSYQSADFWTFHKTLDTKVCTDNYNEIYECMKEFRLEYSNKFATRTLKTVKDAFDACFNMY